MKNNWKKGGLNWRKNRGAIIILMTIALPVLIALAGLAIDSGRAYGVRGKLSAAVDAAALAAARAVANGEPAAIAAANKFYNANIPNDFLDSTPNTPSVTFGYAPSGDITVNVSATANMPTTFSRIVGVGDIDIDSTAQTIRRTVDLAFVVDNTTSLRLGALGDVTDDVVARSKDFIQNFNENFDRVALVKYAFGAEVPVGFNASRGHSRSTIEDEIDAFEFGGNGQPNQFTNISEGMWRAIDALEGASNPASLRVIVFFTDGAPNTFGSEFEFTGGTPSKIGAIRTSSGSSGTPRGLWEVDDVSETSPAPWNFGSNVDDNLARLPVFYTSYDGTLTTLPVLNPSHPRRKVTQFFPGNSANSLYTKVNRVSRNLSEDMATYARQNGIVVLTLGLGSRLQEGTGPDNERGEDMLYRMANDPAMLSIPALAGDYRSDQIPGVYCHAVNKDALGPCFDEMLKVIIRLTM
ncbi:MAG: VWA domain-containing protein [Amphritea sp.]|nr:VWA domain-containing protein [Amphritea sp.]